MPSLHFAFHLVQRAPNAGLLLKAGPKRYTISKQPLLAGRDDKMRQQTQSAPHLPQSSRKVEGTPPTHPEGKVVPQPKSSSARYKLSCGSASAVTYRRQKSWFPQQLASPLAPFNPCFPYSPLFQEFGQKRKAPAAPTFRPAAPRRNPSAAQRM